MKKIVSAALIASILSGCATTGSTTGSPFEVIRYRLPSTSVSAVLSLTLENCTGVPKVSGELNLVAKGGVSPENFTLTAAQLESARIKRSLAITLHDTGAIATVESSAEDRTGAILGNIFKIVGSVLGLAALTTDNGDGNQTPAVVPPVCNPQAIAALARVAQIDAQIERLRGMVLPAKPTSATEIAEQANRTSRAIDRLLAERAALREGVLHIELEKAVNLAEPSANKAKIALIAGKPVVIGDTIAFDTTDMAKTWFTHANGLAVSLEWTASPENIEFDPRKPTNQGKFPSAQCRSQLGEKGQNGICFVTPEPVAFAAKANLTGIAYDGDADELASKGDFPVAQWGQMRFLGLDVGFGGNRQLAMTLDKFGRTSEMKWSSDAKAENITGGLAGVAEGVAGVAQAHSQVARQKAEIEALTTQQTLNRLRACREILAKGGSECPAEAKVAE